mmetsp:Transcript_13294/g.25194  ORF Transcript_13294/g.25194 Transcript_13294/m.25194 type:complete len:322 (-) Transcript_13294:131-1096(-)
MCRPSTTPSQVSHNETVVNKSGNAATKGHPAKFDDFYKAHPSFIWGPILVVGFLHGLNFVPTLKSYFEASQMEAFGLESALQYTVFAIVTSYAFHGWCSTHVPHHLKIQSAFEYEVTPPAMATRSTAALLTELVYTFMPLAPNSTTWVQFALWTAALGIYWDAHFYVAHRFCHENKAAYKFFHKTHHLCKEPNCFGAYFVTYQSHIVLEQLVVFILAVAGLPRDVFVFSMYWGTIATYIEHSGFELGSMKLPLVPLTIGHLSTLLSLPTAWLEGVNVAEHDWHHEKFTTNYSLSFKYLDKIFGTYHPGRVPGEQKASAKAE